MSRQQVTATPPRAVLRRLAEVHADDDGCLSLYVDLDPSVFPTVREQETEIESLLDQVHAAWLDKKLPHDEKNARADTIGRIRERLFDRDFAQNKARSIVFFAAPSADVFEEVNVGQPVAPTFVVDATPYLRPLAGDPGPRTWAVLLLDKRRARLFYGGERRLIEVDSFEDNVPAHQKQGGWSAEKNQRHADEAAKEHIDAAVDKLFAFFEQTGFDALAIAAPEEAYTWVTDKLHPYLQERFRGRITIETDFPNAEQVLECASRLMAEARENAVADLLHRMDEAPRDRVAFGASPVFDALFQRRVDTLVLQDGFTSAGVRCPECGWLGFVGPKCPMDAVATNDVADVMDDAIDLAFLQDARVITIDRDAERQPEQPISALLRY